MALCRRGREAQGRIVAAYDAFDATQEAMIAIVRGLGRFDGRSAFSTWAYRVATNACLDELRRRLMIAAAAVEWRFGIAAERRPLETVARPLAFVE